MNMKISRLIKTWVSAFAGMTIFLSAQIVSADDDIVRTISVVGEAKISMVPDRATITVEVRAEQMDLDAAKKEHDDKLRNLLKLAKKYDIDDSDQRTNYGRVSPQWEWKRTKPNNNNERVFKGYLVSTSVSFTLKNFDHVGPFLEDVVRTKPNTMNGPNYHIKDQKPTRDKARVAAMSDANAKARALAKEGGIKLGKPITISDRYQAPQKPIMRRSYAKAEMMMADSAMSAAPVAPPAGEQQVHAQVYVTYELID